MDLNARKSIPWHGLKKIFPRTLFARSLLIIVVPVLLLQIVTTLVFVDNHWRKVTSRMAFAVAGEIAIITDDLDKSDNAEKVKKISTTYAQKLDLLVTFEPDAKLTPEIITAGAWGPFIAEALKKSIDTQIRKPYSLSFSPENNWVNIGIQLDSGVLRVLVLERRLYSSSANIFLMWVLGTSLILFAVAVFFMRNQIRPIRKLALMAERMGKGQDLSGFKPEGAREVRQAARAFIDMHHRITRQVEQRTAMLAGVSHDLRTPLTRIKLGLSFIDESEDVKALKGDVIDMERMINSYLNFLRGDGEEGTERISLSDLVTKIADGVRRHGKSIHTDIAPTLMVNVRPMAFERALQNLVSNAEKYGSEIWVSAKDKIDDVIIMVDDNGIGLSSDLFEDVFKPFYRADESRNSSTGGVGLGLPIVRDIIHAHGGEVHLEKSPKGGLRAVITLPI
jgi:two-component system, OmpR family, osmolarity sensor histidine kinase EnvZ